jgi:outer membrane lipoprotein LolB
MTAPVAISAPLARPAAVRPPGPTLALPLALTLALGLALSACAPLPPVSSAVAAVPRHASEHFELEGRLAASDGERAASGRIEWQHARGADTWTLISPLGQIVARLDSQPGSAMLLTASGERVFAASADELLPRLLGLAVPTASLSRWVQAVPGVDAEVRALDASGRPAQVLDQGWRIDYPDYTSPAADARPARVDLTRGDARLRLIIDTWQASH